MDIHHAIISAWLNTSQEVEMVLCQRVKSKVFTRVLKTLLDIRKYFPWDYLLQFLIRLTSYKG